MLSTGTLALVTTKILFDSDSTSRKSSSDLQQTFRNCSLAQI